VKEWGRRVWPDDIPRRAHPGKEGKVAVTKTGLWQAVKNIFTLGRAGKKQ
jgi:hypothetical protein